MKYFLKHIQVIIVIVSGSLLSFWLFQYVDQKSHDEVKQQFISNAKDRLFAIENNIESEITTLKSLVGLYASSNTITRSEFAKFVEIMSAESKVASYLSFEWVPRVTLAARKSYVEVAKQDGYADFRITERSEDGQLITAKIRQEYFPVYFVNPYEGNESALGFDLASTPLQKLALEKARDTGQMVASGLTNLVQTKENSAGVLIFTQFTKMMNLITPLSKGVSLCKVLYLGR